ncbi:hypothetical protein LJC24_01500 [Desulfococcaceae bacterium OttesenSCG-928-F15]|nr:hypothetical protein [Desulfococcaceae bacterium OttesenSCG-928-F15]
MKIRNKQIPRIPQEDVKGSTLSDLNWDEVARIFKEKHQIPLQDEINFLESGVVVRKGEVAYKLSFDMTVCFDLFLNRQGQCIDVSARDLEEEENTAEEAPKKERIPSAGMARMASELFSLMEEINKDEEL